MKTCADCRFFAKNRNNAYDGECRMNPPTIHIQTIYYNEASGMQNIDTINTWWPNVATGSWCGKWQGKTRDQRIDEAARILTDKPF